MRRASQVKMPTFAPTFGFPMLDIQLLRKDLANVAQRLASRGVILDTARIESLEAERKEIQTRTQDLQARRNQLSKQIGMAKGKGEDAGALMAEVTGLGDELKAAETRLEGIQEDLSAQLMTIPNLPHESVPVGRDEKDNVEVRRVGTRANFPTSRWTTSMSARTWNARFPHRREDHQQPLRADARRPGPRCTGR
jgi:seryl-tRNA synthetase